MMLYRVVIVALFLKIVSSSAALCRCILFPNEIIAILFAAGRRLVACGCGLRSALQQREQKQAARALVINCAKRSHHGSGPCHNIAISGMRLMLMCPCAATLVEATGG
jgi:uncharacterized protein YcbK (DUF882 family)